MTAPSGEIRYDAAAVATVVDSLRQTSNGITAGIAEPAHAFAASSTKPLSEGVERSPVMSAIAETMAGSAAAAGEVAASVADLAARLEKWRGGTGDIDENAAAATAAQGGTS